MWARALLYNPHMAMPQVTERLLTAEEFFLLPDPDHGGKTELVCGRVVTQMPVSGKHAKRAGLIIRRLGNFIEAHELGEIGPEAGFLIKRAPDSVRAPDVAFFANEVLGESGLPEQGFVPFAPTLAVEIVSPGDLDREVSAKVDDYLRAGVQRIWIVRPPLRNVTVYHADGTARVLDDGATLTSDDAGFTTEGFELPIASLFD